MSKTPIDLMLDAVAWKAREGPAPDGDIPYATHEGVLSIGGVSLRCYRLNTGQSIFNADDFKEFFGALLDPVDEHGAECNPNPGRDGLTD